MVFPLNGGFFEKKMRDFRVRSGILEEKMNHYWVTWGISEEKWRFFGLIGVFEEKMHDLRLHMRLM